MARRTNEGLTGDEPDAAAPGARRPTDAAEAEPPALAGGELTLRQLRALHAVVREGSVTAAAQRLGIRQPSLSQQIARMEELAGVKLVRFLAEGPQLTPAGDFLFNEADALLAAFDRTCSGLDDFVQGRRHRMVIGTLPSLARELLVPAFARVVEKGVRVLMDVREMTPIEGVQAIERRQIDAALVSAYAAEALPQTGLQSVEVALDAQFLAVPAGLADLSGESRPELLEDEALRGRIELAFGTPHGDQLTHWHARLFPQAGTVARCASYDTALAHVAAGLGTAIVPGLALRGGHAGERIDSYELPLPERRTLLLWPERSVRTGPLDALAAEIRAVARDLSPLPCRAAPPFASERLGNEAAGPGS